VKRNKRIGNKRKEPHHQRGVNRNKGGCWSNRWTLWVVLSLQANMNILYWLF